MMSLIDLIDFHVHECTTTISLVTVIERQILSQQLDLHYLHYIISYIPFGSCVAKHFSEQATVSY